jgi:glycosyltransferase involved in cell wall biosynthesis
MKLVFLVHQFFPTYYMGTERFTLDLAKQMQKMGHNPIVVTYDPDPGRDGFETLTKNILTKNYTYETIPVVALKHTTPRLGFDVFDDEVEQAFKKLEITCDLVHLCHPMRLSSAAKLYKSAGVPVLMTLTDSWLLCTKAMRDDRNKLCLGPKAGDECTLRCGARMKSRLAEARQVFDMADEVVVASRFLSALFRSNGWNRTIRTIPHSIDYANVRRPEKQPSDQITFAFIGTIAWHKGLHVVVEAFRKIPCRNLRLRIYGRHSPQSQFYFNRVRELAREDDRIRFMDPFRIQSLPEVMADISAIVIPSTYYEPYPLVMLISLAYKIPLIVSNIGGMPEVVKDGFDGFLFEPGDADQLANIIRRILREPQILDQLRRNIATPRRTEEEALDYENIYRRLSDRQSCQQ